jgi:hypothetical protein
MSVSRIAIEHALEAIASDSQSSWQSKHQGASGIMIRGLGMRFQSQCRPIPMFR